MNNKCSTEKQFCKLWCLIQPQQQQQQQQSLLENSALKETRNKGENALVAISEKVNW